ncbi:MAG: SurA N-terminal domain-containing protein [Treponema sp.]|nr:SurA N-terminal domain-containing protein [Treponema sp.]
MKKLAIGTFMVLTGLFAATAQASLYQQLAVVKITDTEVVTVKEVKDIVDTQEKEAGRKLTPQERAQTYETIINQKLILQAAKKAGVTVSASELDEAFLANISQQLNLPRVYSEKELNDLVMANKKMSFAEFVKDQTGMGVEEVKNQIIRPDLIWRRYLLSQNQQELQKISATDKEIRDYYELNKTQFIRPDSLKMFLVAVPKENDPQGARVKLEGLLKDVKSGKKTIEQMRRDGQNPKEAGYGAGDLYLMKVQQHAAQLGVSYEELLKIFDGDVNKPSEIMDAGQVLQFYIVLEKYPFKALEISDVVRPESTQTIYETISALVTQTKQLQFLEQKRQETIKSLNTPENVTRKKTGDDLIKLLSW